MRASPDIKQGRVTEGLRVLDEAMLPVVAGRVRPTYAGNIYCQLMSVCRAPPSSPRCAEVRRLPGDLTGAEEARRGGSRRRRRGPLLRGPTSSAEWERCSARRLSHDTSPASPRLRDRTHNHLLAGAFPRSTFVGYDLAADAIERPAAEAREDGLANVAFEVLDVTQLPADPPLDAGFVDLEVHEVGRPTRLGVRRPQARLTMARARDGRRVGILGCGDGTLAILIARASPDDTVAGFDIDRRAIVRAGRAAAAAGVADRVTFEVAATVLGHDYDLLISLLPNHTAEDLR